MRSAAAARAGRAPRGRGGQAFARGAPDAASPDQVTALSDGAGRRSFLGSIPAPPRVAAALAASIVAPATAAIRDLVAPDRVQLDSLSGSRRGRALSWHETRSIRPMTTPMLPRERCDYSAIVDRPPLKLPDDARLVLWTIVNYEVWDIARPMPRQVLPAPTGVPLLPDVPHWSWHEYGMRVGAWRFFELYERLAIRPTLAINARTCEDYARVAEEAKRLGWEFMAHAYDQIPIHKVEDQAAMINRSMDILERFTGKRPVGWLGPGLTQTLDTPELLVSAGVKYIGDWVYDDEPTTIRTAKGPLVTLPYTVEINDIGMMIVQHHESEYLARRAIDQFERLYAEGKHRAKIMALAIHPYISGQPHRIKYLEAIYDHVRRFSGVLHWNGAEILDWYLAATANPAAAESARARAGARGA
jgi:allantoinase